MLASLDLSPVFSGKRSAGDVPFLRPMLYGTQPPGEFLVRSVDAARANDPEEVVNPLVPVHWLVEPRDKAQESGMTEGVQLSLKAGLTRTLECSLSPRERLQVWYCLRQLGVRPDAIESNKLLGVIFEFPQQTSLSVLGIYSDRSVVALWEGGAKRWAPYDEGAPSVMAQDLLKEATPLGEYVSAPIPELPNPVRPKHVLIVFLYASGLRVLEVPLANLAQSPYLALYNHAASLFGILCSGPAAEDPPMDLDDPKWAFGSLLSRAGALFADLVIYAALVVSIIYFSRETLAKWDILARTLLGFCLLALPPFVAAWMESSPAWGFRTVGKHLFGVVVCSTSDSLGPLYVQALARNMAKWFLSAPFLCCGFVWAFFHRYRRTWHDLLSNTVVLEDEETGDSDAPLEPARPPLPAAARQLDY